MIHSLAQNPVSLKMKGPYRGLPCSRKPVRQLPGSRPVAQRCLSSATDGCQRRSSLIHFTPAMPIPIRHLALGAAVIALSVLAFAQQHDGALAKRFKQLDRNHDGVVTSDEAPAAIMQKFDLDRNGSVTLEEAERASSGTPGSEGENDATLATRLFEFADKNHDGKITREESGNARWFDRLDQTKDGEITLEEVRAAAKQIRQYVEANRGAQDIPGASEPAQPPPAGPAIRNGGELGVGRQVPDIAFTDLDGGRHTLADLVKGKGLVIAFTSTTCPVSKRYTPSLLRLESELKAKGMPMLLVNPFASEATSDMKAQGFQAVYVHDSDKSLAGSLRARTTTETFLLDATRTLVYRGAIDDQYGVNYNRDAPDANYLRDAIAANLTGRLPQIEATDAPGCELDLPAAVTKNTSVTYHRDVARILQQNCVECHHTGGLAPFALDNLDEITDRAKVIRRVVTQGTMPPWFAAPAAAGSVSQWGNDCSLSTRDKADLLAWLDSTERPMGDAADAPAPLRFIDGWVHGEPDYVVPIPRPMKIKAEGFMPYQFEVAETTLTEDKWVRGYEIVPTDRSVVHHVIVNVHTGGGKLRDRDEGTSGYWAAYVPGNSGQMYPAGFARKLPAGSRISFQIHYTPSGKATTDQLKMGLYFASAPPKYVVQTLAIPKRDLSIAPGDANHVETASKKVPSDMTVMALMAHMHVRGKAFRFDLTMPDGKKETLLDIPHYDFNWQLRYDYAAPRIIPRGSTVTITAVYDNSTQNKANPDPGKLVRWGPQTVDEMMIGYIETCVPYRGPETASR